MTTDLNYLPLIIDLYRRCVNFGQKRFIQQAEGMKEQTKLRRYGGTSQFLDPFAIACVSPM